MFGQVWEIPILLFIEEKNWTKTPVWVSDLQSLQKSVHEASLVAEW